MARIRYKGVAVVKANKGILVVADRSKKFILPGGGIEKRESRKKAAMRELREETGLRTKGTKYLFSYKGHKWADNKGCSTINHAKVFLIKTYGRARPRSEIKYINYWKLGSRLNISRRTMWIINKYLEMEKV